MDLVLKVAINYVKSGLISHYNIVFIHIFISDWSLTMQDERFNL